MTMKPKHIILFTSALALSVSLMASQSVLSLSETTADSAAPTHLTLEKVDDKTVVFSWYSPEAINGYWDDFEQHTDFAINSPGQIGWQYIDGDNRDTYTWNAGNFPGQGSKMAFVVMNGSEMSFGDLDISTNPNFQPVSGKKMLLDFCSIGAANNDYIISPELSFDEPFQISFQARSYNVNYGAERVRVGYSTTGCRQSDFTFVTTRATDNGTLAPKSGCDYLELPAAWTLIRYEIPAEARYVCVNCVSDDAFMFMLDDLFVGTNNVRPDRTPQQAPARQKLMGFNIYRNGERLNAEPYTSEVFTDQVPQYALYDYKVTAAYSDGTESEPSEVLTVDVKDVTLLPFEDTFSAWFLDYNNWSTPGDAQGNESRWTSGYYEYGLVNPSAVYSYSNLRFYDQSLVSRELRTADDSNTWLRFTVQLVCFEPGGELDYLDAEVKGLDERQWHSVQTLSNEGGSFARTTFLCDLSSYLSQVSDGRFQVRFRAHGSDAQKIDYWYLDDVKVWNPVWSSATLQVTDGTSPVAGIKVQLKGQQGSSYEAVSDVQGRIELPKVEVDDYDVVAIAEGYNNYHTMLSVGTMPAQLQVNLTRPQLQLSALSIEADDMATEQSLTRELVISNQGTGPAVWNLEQSLPKGKGSTANRFTLGPVFNLSGDLQSSIVFDGENFYTSSWYFLGKFYKYDRQGTFIEEFSIPEMYYMVYDFAYDGRYVYASDYSNRIFQLDMDARHVVSIIDIPALPNLKITHLAYDPDRDGFWCGTFNTLVFINRQGEQQAMEMTWDCSAFGSAYDNVTPGGPYLWVSDMTLPDDVIIDKVMLRQYSLNSRSFTGVSHVINDMPGYINGSANTGQNQVCGVTVTSQLVPGQLTLIGTLQQSPSLVYTYNLCDFDQWLTLQPTHGTLQPGQQQTVSIGFNSLRSAVADVSTSALTLVSKPTTQQQVIDVSMHVTHATDVPRPQQLTAQTGVAEVSLMWQGNAAAQSYVVLRDGCEVARTEGASACSYIDHGLVFGTYRYQVQAVYAGGMSLLSDAVIATVKQGAPYYAPMHLSASISGNQDVTLQWQSPLAMVGQEATLMWGTGQNADQLGVGSGFFYAGQKWTASDLVPYRNKSITRVNVRVCAPVSYLAARIYEDGKLVSRTVYSDKIAYGEYTAIHLTKPVTIQPGCEYIVAVQVQAADGIRPLAMDDDNNFDGRGNLISLDGNKWYNASQTAISGNFNISFTAEGSPLEAEEEAPAAYRIFRDGELVGQAEACAFADVVTTPGMHEYAVSSLYADGGESPVSAEARVKVLDIVNRRSPDSLATQLLRNRIVSLGWTPAPSAEAVGQSYSFPVDLDVQRHTQLAGYPEYLNSWSTSGTEMAVASDGQYVYTSVYTESGRILVYDLSGKYLGRCLIKDDNLGGIRNLAWDGKHLWAADNSPRIHRLNVNVTLAADGYRVTGELVDSYSIAEYSRHLAYIPEMNGGQGGFETGDWNTSILVSRTGAKMGTGPSYHAAAGTAYYAGRIYAFEQNHPLGAHCVVVYDYLSHQQLAVIDLEQYAELTDVAESFAGGASTFQTADGMTILALCLQFSDRPSRLLFLDLSGSLGVTGYNVYRNGELVSEGQPMRHYTDTLTTVGEYGYQVSTRYLDGSQSELSPAATIRIVEAGTVEAPASVQALPAAYPYNVNISFADPQLFDAALASEDFEQGRLGDAYRSSTWNNLAGGWAITDVHYHGQQGIMAAAGAEAWLVIPVNGGRWFSFMARNESVAGTSGSLEVYFSRDGDNVSDFILLDQFTTLDPWQSYDVQLPEGSEYVILRKAAECATAQFVDAVRISAETPVCSVYGYDIYRNGLRLNDEPVCGISYIDHNLAQGQYHYEVRAISHLSAISEPAVADIDLRYDNGGQAPVGLQATIVGTEQHPAVELSWQAPAIGGDINLAWHSGRNQAAAGLPSGGAYWAGVRWSPADLLGYDSLAVSEVEIYINQVPEALYIMLYEGNELVRQQRVERPHQYAFNRIALNDPLRLNTQKELRLVVYVEHNEITLPLGYDEGPCVADGKSNIYSSDGVTWLRLSDEGTQIDANWNFGIVLRPYELAKAEASLRARSRGAAPGSILSASEESSLNALRGYRVYVNREAQNDQPISELTWQDDVVRPGIPYLEYQVKAIYTLHGEVSSSIVRIQNPMQEFAPNLARDEETAIQQVADDTQSLPHYNLQGQRTDSPHGMLVTDGKVEFR